MKVTDRVPEEDQPARSLWDGPASDGFSLPDARPASAIRDSLYDFIPLGQLELDLIGTPEFVRLQGVKQLGFCYRVWPGATHTRFEHSLGVYFLALRGLRALLDRRDSPEPSAATRLDLRVLLAAALLHDIGHYPFSHAIEELGYPIAPHERRGPPHHRDRRGRGSSRPAMASRPAARRRSDRSAARPRAARQRHAADAACSVARSTWTSSTISRATPAPATCPTAAST